MRRIAVIFALALTVFLQSAAAQAGWHEMKATWNCFWDRVHVDWHRNNAWPEPFNLVDRKAVGMPIAVMVDRGWKLQNTIPNQLFDSETQELTRAGELKVRWILTQMPSRRRSVFVLRGRTPEITETRLKSVEKAAVDVIGDSASAMIAVTDIIPRGGSGAYYESVSKGYETSAPTPRLPDMESTSEGD